MCIQVEGRQNFTSNLLEVKHTYFYMYAGASIGKWRPKQLIDLHAYTLYTKLKKIAIMEK